MKKYIFIGGLVFLFFIGFWVAVNLIEAQDTPESVALQSSFGNVTLSHQKHTGLTTCNECHHKGMDDPKCSNCHTKDSAVNAMTAMHKNCIDCHKAKSSGPTECTDCHKK